MLGNRPRFQALASRVRAARHRSTGTRPTATPSRGSDGRDRYVRQLRDVKISALVEDCDADDLRAYGRMCGWALARGHARSGDAAMIAGYMGTNDAFDDAICEFAHEYADQNRLDHRALVKAVREGRVKAMTEA